jgi:hypothetical protein
MGMLAFVAWLTFFLVFKIRGDFYFFETSELNIPDATGFKETTLVRTHRTPAAAVGVMRNASGQLNLIFDDGKTFLFPQQKALLERHVKKRAQRLELTAMLTKSPTRTIGRMQIWADASISFAVIREVMVVFTHMGFDEFDFAMTISPRTSNRRSALNANPRTHPALVTEQSHPRGGQ